MKKRVQSLFNHYSINESQQHTILPRISRNECREEKETSLYDSLDRSLTNVVYHQYLQNIVSFLLY